MNRATHYAGLRHRTGAALVDATSMLVLTLISLFTWCTLTNEIMDLNRLGSVPVLAVAAGVYLLLAIYLDSRMQGTPGLKIMGCRLLDAQSGQSISLAKSLLRNLLWPLSVLPAMLGIIWMLFDSKAQMFHDKLVGTVVVIDDIARQSLDELERWAG